MISASPALPARKTCWPKPRILACPRWHFPDSGLLLRAEIEDLHQQLAAITITDEEVEELQAGSPDDEERGFAYGGIKSLKDRIDYCYQHQLALITFCH